MLFFVPRQIVVVNKQYFSPLVWNNPLSKIVLGDSHILMIDGHLDAKKKLSLDAEGVYNLSYFFQSLIWLPYAQHLVTVEEAASLTRF